MDFSCLKIFFSFCAQNIPFMSPDILGDTHEAMNRAVELADENTDLTKELHDVEKTNRLLEEDVLNTAETLTQKLQRTKVNNTISFFF